MKLERAARSVLYPVTNPTQRKRLILARNKAVGLIAAGRGKLRVQHPLPDFIIAGVQKGGTTFLFQEMLRHPQIKGPLTKEVHFFDAQFDRGVDWYAGMFPGSYSNKRVIRGEATPGYIVNPTAVRRISETLPDPRVIVVLRDPVQRALSHYKHERRLGFEPSSTFEDALALEDARVADEFDQLNNGSLTGSWTVGHFGYVRRGLYADQLKHAEAMIGRERLLVLISEEMFADPVGATTAALDFVGATPPLVTRVGANDMSFEAEPMREDTNRMLRERFAKPNAELAEFLGRELPW